MGTGSGRGFTLVEMMIALLVLAVLLVVGAPALYELIRDNRMLSHVYAIRAALDGARSEAMAQRSFVTFCRSSDGASCSGQWNEGYIAFLDVNGNAVVDDPNSPNGDRIFVAKVIDNDSLDIHYSGGNPAVPTANTVRFDSQGYARGGNGVFTVCDDRGDPKRRGLLVAPGGLVRALDPNDVPACP